MSPHTVRASLLAVSGVVAARDDQRGASAMTITNDRDRDDRDDD